jgi:signal transduction histidine kinase
MSFEIHCRYISSNQEGEINILLNDVSRIKLKEKQNAEFKYKTLFLSKVAHEFKNPLICISELINQSYESLPKKMSEEIDISKNLKQVKNLSNFLLILIKDLNYFSESLTGKLTVFEKNETDLLDLVCFSKHITKTLLQKSNKLVSVDIVINFDPQVPDKIVTDEWRLKQILINLLSNSVKFTLFGKIVLDISMEEIDNKSCIKFLVHDTGVGIKSENFESLFKPFQKDQYNKNNEMGSGLGLSICKEIASILGMGMNFQSKEGEGSTFWFHIPIVIKPIASKNNTLTPKKPVPKIFINTVVEDPQLKLNGISDSEGCSSASFNGTESNETREINNSPFRKPHGSTSYLYVSESERSEKRYDSCKTEENLKSVKSKLSSVNFYFFKIIINLFTISSPF